ncbi:MAG: Methyltransferase type 12 [Candidatus Jettenia ecosi]|uniref:Methyltransferase type 12 n=1 Tax=Candidatus Jettenia ecosi TaxID=2494326 RepID=A0A533QQR4_9BACT|nr:MAG: Methyltransferase type 12 [Candidatus Jettenia ecosi]
MKKNMLRETVYAFNNTDIVATYDFDMDVWHPNRTKMALVVCEILPFYTNDNLRILDLGVGTGYLTHKLIETFPNARVIAVDAAELMIEKAKLRLKDHLKQITFQTSTFQELPDKGATLSPMDVVVSSFALHHLYKEEKLILFKYIHSILKPNGWFINCDIFKATDTVLEDRFRYLHRLGIQQRIKRIKHQEKSIDQISSELIEKEKKGGDHPLFLMEDMELLKKAGFRITECFWKEYREAVYGGIK